MSDYVPQGVPSGTILAFAGNTPPSGYLWCDGASLSRADYAALFAAIGTRWGTADGNSFNVPDTRGLFLRGFDNGAGYDPDRAARTAIKPGGVTSNQVGSYQRDQMQRITGNTGMGIWGSLASGAAGAISQNTQGGNGPGGGGNSYIQFQFNSANSPNARVSATTDGETRPSNVYVLYIIKI